MTMILVVGRWEVVGIGGTESKQGWMMQVALERPAHPSHVWSQGEG